MELKGETSYSIPQIKCHVCFSTESVGNGELEIINPVIEELGKLNVLGHMTWLFCIRIVDGNGLKTLAQICALIIALVATTIWLTES